MLRNLSFLLVLGALQAPAQWAKLPLDSTLDRMGEDGNRLIVEGWAEQSSNTVYNELLFGLLRGGYLDRSLRERSRDATVERNSLGYDLGAHVLWVGKDSLFGMAGVRPMIRVGHRDVLGTRFTKDVFAIAFFGNAPYEGRTAFLGGAHMAMRYQSAGFGVASRDQRRYLRIDVVNGQSMNASLIPIADVTTGVDGRLIEADLNARYWSSDTAGSGLGGSNGLGMALSGRWSFNTMSGDMPVHIGVEVHDLGFMVWNDRSVRLSRDTLLSFEGLTVEDIFDLDGVLADGEQLLDTFGLRYTAGSFTTLLPFRLALNMDFTLGNGWYTGFMAQQVNLPGFAPQFTAFGAKRLGNERTLLGGELTAGGFGGIRVGARARHRFGERYWVHLGLSHLPAFITGRTRGFGAQFGFATNF